MKITHTMNCHTEQFTQQKHALCVSYWYFRKCTPKKMFKMCHFWMYSVNLGILIPKGVHEFLSILVHFMGD